MSEHGQRKSALEGGIVPGHHGAAGSGIGIRIRRDLTMVGIVAFETGSEAVPGVTLPPANQALEAGDRTYLWLGPGRWLIVAPGGIAPPVASPGVAFLDRSHARTVLRVTGKPVRDLLAKGVALDLHPDRFRKGQCLQTLCAHMSVIIHAVDEVTVDLYVSRSYARHLMEWLLDAALEYGCFVEDGGGESLAVPPSRG